MKYAYITRENGNFLQAREEKCAVLCARMLGNRTTAMLSIQETAASGLPPVQGGVRVEPNPENEGALAFYARLELARA